ncbi:MAG: chemotaxis protein CheD [Sedimentisphaerales bacterium]|nr:chemotaxis protein CheD [Sedimentisphaerales bacterium]
MEETVDVDTGEVKVAVEGTILRSVVIGSCVVVAALNVKRKIGAMTHIMLPGSAPENAIDKTKYAANVINRLINIIPDAELERGHIEACLVGTGNVLKKKDDTVCKANIESTTHLLKEKNIPVRVYALGGTERKSVFMDIGSGLISYAEGDEKEKPLRQVSQYN